MLINAHGYRSLARNFSISSTVLLTLTSYQSGAGAVEKDELLPLPFQSMPGPKPLPIVGNSLELKRNLARLRMYFQESFKEYGDIFRVKTVGRLCL